MGQKYIDDRIKILRTASQSLVALYFIGFVLVLSVFEKNPYEIAHHELEALFFLENELKNPNGIKVVKKSEINKNDGLFNVIESDLKIEFGYRTAYIYHAITSDYGGGGSLDHMRLDINEFADPNFEVHISPREVEGYGIYQKEIRSIKNIGNWIDLFEVPIEIGSLFPSYNYFEEQSIQIIQEANENIQNSELDSIKKSELEWFDFDKHFIEQASLNLVCKNFEFGDCSKEFEFEIDVKSVISNLEDSTEKTFNHKILLFPYRSDLDTVYMNVTMYEYLLHLDLIKKPTLSSEKKILNTLFTDSLSFLPGITSLYDELKERDLKSADYYLKTKKNEAKPVSFFGVTISRLLSSVTFPLLVMVLMIYHLFHLKKVELQDNYYPWIPLQKGILELLYSSFIYILLPATISVFLFYDKQLIDEEMMFFMSLSITVINIGLGLKFVDMLSKKSV